MKKVLVVGGAGYIGSHTCLELKEQGYTPVIIDNFSYGSPEFAQNFEYYQGDLSSRTFIRNVFTKNTFYGVIHFAASTYVGESCEKPLLYFQNNVANTLNLISVMDEFNCKNIVFSSTCATYGDPKEEYLTESHPQNPINPYGTSKFLVEKILRDCSLFSHFSTTCLRYFNAAGADYLLRSGESHNPETHLIPLALEAALGMREPLKVFGNDYPTIDGTCIRDYIHVTDLALAHILALEYNYNTSRFDFFNLGSAHGSSVLEVLNTIEKVVGKKVPYSFADRRKGDPHFLVASNKKALDVLGWRLQHSDLVNIISTAHAWICQKN